MTRALIFPPIVVFLLLYFPLSVSFFLLYHPSFLFPPVVFILLLCHLFYCIIFIASFLPLYLLSKISMIMAFSPQNTKAYTTTRPPFNKPKMSSSNERFENIPLADLPPVYTTYSLDNPFRSSKDQRPARLPEQPFDLNFFRPRTNWRRAFLTHALAIILATAVGMLISYEIANHGGFGLRNSSIVPSNTTATATVTVTSLRNVTVDSTSISANHPMTNVPSLSTAFVYETTVEVISPTSTTVVFATATAAPTTNPSPPQPLDNKWDMAQLQLCTEILSAICTENWSTSNPAALADSPLFADCAPAFVTLICGPVIEEYVAVGPLTTTTHKHIFNLGLCPGMQPICGNLGPDSPAKPIDTTTT